MTTPDAHKSPRNDQQERHMRRSVPAILLVLVLVAGSWTAPVAAQDAPSPSFVVDLHDDGSATVTVTYTFDLTTEAEQEAFRTLQDDKTAREELKSRFETRLGSVADAVANRTGRTMSVSDSTIDIRTEADGNVGVVRLSIEWSGLARTEGDELVVTEPFASEFRPDRRFILNAPERYEFATVTPSPDDRSAGSLEWAPNTDLSGFEVVIAPAENPTPTPTEGSGGTDGATETGGQPGFGLVSGMMALIAGMLFVRRVRR